VTKRLREREISLEVTAAAKKHIAEAGYDPVYGARPLKRYIQRELETKIGRALIAGQLQPGSVIRVDVGADGLRVSTSESAVVKAA
jgi:ATP-dependent Clp protease ATP-binding subunit ClpB